MSTGDGEGTSARRRRGRSAALLLASIALLAAAYLPGPALRAAETRPSQWSGTALAAGIDISLNTDPRLLPIDEFVHLTVPDAFTSWTSTIAVARASPVYPGTSGTGGPKLMCELGFPCPPGFPPDYPLSASAQYPTHTDAATPAGTARAHAGADEVWSTATGAGPAGDALAALADLVDADVVTARSDQRFDGDVLTVTSRTELHGIVLFDGVVTIDSLLVSAHARFGPDVRETAGTVQLVGVTAAGQPASIGSEGITVGGAGVPADVAAAAQHALDRALAERQADVRLVGTDHDDGEGAARTDSVGLLVSARVEVPGPALPLPVSPFRAYLATMRIGHAAAEAYTDDGALGSLLSGDLVGAGLTGPLAPPAAPSGGPLSAALGGGDSGGGSAGRLNAGAPPVMEGTGPATSGDSEPDLLGGTVAERLRLLYALAGALGIAAFAGSRVATLRTTAIRGTTP